MSLIGDVLIKNLIEFDEQICFLEEKKTKSLKSMMSQRNDENYVTLSGKWICRNKWIKSWWKYFHDKRWKWDKIRNGKISSVEHWQRISRIDWVNNWRDSSSVIMNDSLIDNYSTKLHRSFVRSILRIDVASWKETEKDVVREYIFSLWNQKRGKWWRNIWFDQNDFQLWRRRFERFFSFLFFSWN